MVRRHSLEKDGDSYLDFWVTLHDLFDPCEREGGVLEVGDVFLGRTDVSLPEFLQMLFEYSGRVIVSRSRWGFNLLRVGVEGVRIVVARWRGMLLVHSGVSVVVALGVKSLNDSVVPSIAGLFNSVRVLLVPRRANGKPVDQWHSSWHDSQSEACARQGRRLKRKSRTL